MTAEIVFVASSSSAVMPGLVLALLPGIYVLTTARQKKI
jgi:hypothetical protein